MLNAELAFAQRHVDNNMDKTLQELDQKQQARMNSLINELMVQQGALCKKILAQSCEPNCPVFAYDESLKNLLIDGAMLDPLEAINQRTLAINNFLTTANKPSRQKTETP